MEQNQAEAIVETFGIVQEEVATKSDLRELESRLNAKLETKFGELDARVSNLETSMGKLETKISSVDTRLIQMEASIETRFHQVQWRMIGSVAVLLSVFVAAAKALDFLF